MLLSCLVILPFIGTFFVICINNIQQDASLYKKNHQLPDISNNNAEHNTRLKNIALSFSGLNLIISLITWILYDNSNISHQLIQERYTIGHYDFYLGIDGISIYFVILTTLIVPISILSNWKSLKKRLSYFLCIMLLLEGLLLIIFLTLDIFMFYIFFESILAPLFILIGLLGATEKLRAGFYFFLYTFLGSLFMLLSIVSILSLAGCTDMNVLSKSNMVFTTQVFMFLGIFIAFAVKTPVIFLNGWLLKAHVESPLSGSVILAAIVLKLSLYGVFRLILPFLPKAYLTYTFIILVIAGITVVYASLSTIRTIDVKELIAYSSVSHAAVYLAGVFSNTIQGLQGGICLGVAHGFVSSGLFISVGGTLYDRSGTRLITYYKGMAQIMPIFAIFFFILSLGNCGAPLTFNFIGEFMSIFGVFERLPLAGIVASTSIIFSAAFTIYMYNRISFAGNYKVEYWTGYLPDLKFREHCLYISLIIFTIGFGIFPSLMTDGLHIATSMLIYAVEYPDNFTLPSLEAR